MQPRRMLVTDAAAQPPRQSSVWLISTLGKNMNPQAQQNPEGYFSEMERNWVIYPLADRQIRGKWIEIGSAGVDGITFGVHNDEEGVYAYYPIERKFIRKADDIFSLIDGWRSGKITV